MKSFLLILLSVLLMQNAGIAQPATSKKLKAELIATVDSIINGAVAHELVPGAVVEIKQNGKVIYKQAYGYSQRFDINHHLLPDPPKMNVQTLFDMASLTKVIGTTTSIMLLVDKGEIHIDDPVSKYINDFDSFPKSTITIRHLLTHTAGLIEWYPLFYQSSNRESTYKLIHSLPLKYPVGQRRSYSDLGFMLLGEIVENVSGMSLDDFEKKNIFMPLGMNHTFYNPLKNGRTSNIAATSLGNPYETRMVHDSTLGFSVKGMDPDSWDGWRHYVVKGEVNDGNAWYAMQGVSGHAGLFSTMDDVQKLVDMLMNKGRVSNKQFIAASVIDSFFVEDRFHNGLGWMMDSTNSFMKDGPPGTFGHTGFTGTSIAVVPEYNFSVILFINRQNMGLLKSGLYYNPNPIRKEIFETVLKYIK
ncbi:MAG: serine hydrolase [Bacteroidetes bacterium]|nr:serine hydrolase [Bacteroidota bacterium]MBS1930237.1 serine hydrolase [Bacteroidota bacterium]